MYFDDYERLLLLVSEMNKIFNENIGLIARTPYSKDLIDRRDKDISILEYF